MPDYKKTEKIFEEQGLSKIFKKPLELLDDELFEAKLRELGKMIKGL